MDIQRIFNLYGIKVEEILSENSFRAGGYKFQLAYPYDQTEEDLFERMQMANHLHAKGEKGVLIPLQSKEGKFLNPDDGRQLLILGMATSIDQSNPSQGRELAGFHYRGRDVAYRFTKLNRLGQWKSLWEKRTDQLERFWQSKLLVQPQNEFEKLFIDCFPYYLGLMENAIQYLVDSELETADQGQEAATICYERFNEESFHNGKNALDWLLDHPSRDLAEWVRGEYFQKPNTYHYFVRDFMQDYMQALPMSPGGVRLLYARLLFPVQFFEIVESYYTTESEGEKKLYEDQLGADFDNSHYYERFLKNFFEIAGIPQMRSNLRVPEWLQ